MKTTPAASTDLPTRRVRALVLLAGSVRKQNLVRALHRPIIGLPLAGDGTTVLSAWRQFGEAFHRAVGAEGTGMACLVATNGPSEALREVLGGTGIDLRADAEDVRGTGGAIADIAREFGAEDTILVASASSFISSPVDAARDALEVPGSDAVVLATSDRRPTGLYLIRCGLLRALPERGYCDLKEQGLPLLAKEHAVAVRYSDRVRVWPVTSLDQYLAACRARATLGEESFGHFSVVEAGAKVDPTARVVDSVVLSGAVVGPRSVVVRSVVAGGQTIGEGTTVVDELAGTRVA